MTICVNSYLYILSRVFVSPPINYLCTLLFHKNIARKSIVAARHIKAGEVFTAENLLTKRPGDGISPMLWYTVLGQTAKRDFAEDEKIEL